MDNSTHPGYHPAVGCEDYRKDVEAFLSGDTTDERNRALLSHTASCEGCREYLKERRTSRSAGFTAAAPAGTDSGTGTPVPQTPERKIASLNPVLFAAILAVLLIGVMAAMKVRDTTHSFLDRRFWGSTAEDVEEQARAPDEKDIEEVLRRLAEEIPNGPETPSDVDPAKELGAGVRCLEGGDLTCAVERLRKATIAGRGTPQGDEARYHLIGAYTRQKRCVEAMLHLAALAQDSPKNPRLGEAHLQNAECYAAHGQKGEAEQVFRMVALRFPDLREKAMAAIAGLAKKQAK